MLTEEIPKKAKLNNVKNTNNKAIFGFIKILHGGDSDDADGDKFSFYMGLTAKGWRGRTPLARGL